MRKTPSHILVLVYGLLLAACEGPAGPEGPAGAGALAIAVSGPASVTASVDGDGNHNCDAELTAIASGDAGTATWESAVVTFYRASSDVFIVTFPWTAAEVADFWGSASIAAGQTRSSGVWTYTLNEPFTVDLRFRYSTDAGEGEAGHMFTCS